MASFAIVSRALGASLANEDTYDFVYNITKDESLEAVLKDVAGRSQSIDALDIYAHGKVTREYPWNRYEGGYGAFLGKENLKPATVGFFAPLAHHWSRFGTINLQICCIADRSGKDEKTGLFANDGFKICAGIAKHAGTMVRASPDLQEFTSDADSWEGDPYKTTNMDFGDWEGTVYTFFPDGSYMTDE